MQNPAQTFFIHQDLEDPVLGPGIFGTVPAFTTATRTYLNDQFLQRPTVAEEASVRAQAVPVVFSPRCNHHVGLESSAFYDNAVRVPPAVFTDYNDTLGDWWNGGATASLIDGIGGAVTDLPNCVH